MKRPPSTSNNNTSNSSSMPRLIRIIRLGLVAFGIGMMSGTFRKVTKMDLQSYTNTNTGSISSQSDQLLSEDDTRSSESGKMEVSGENNRALTTTKKSQQQTQSSDTDTTAVSPPVAPLESEEAKASESEAAVEPDEKTPDTADDSTPEETNTAEEIPNETNQNVAADNPEETTETEGTETEETLEEEALHEETAEADSEDSTPGTGGNTTDASVEGTTTTEPEETATTEETAESEADEQNDDSESDPAGGTGEESDIIPGNTTLEEIVGDMEDTPTYEAEADQTEGTSEEGADQPKPSKNETETDSQADQSQDTESEGGEQKDTTAKDRPAEAESDQGGDQEKPISTSEETTEKFQASVSAPAPATTHTTTLSKPASNHTITAPSSMTTRPVGMGACLLIKDDNHWVIEWLAFHWFVIPLRYLVVVIDPSSVTSPLQILDRWKDLMEIEIWHDKDFINEQKITKQTRDIYKQNTQLMKHRHRQATFYNKFLRHVHRHKKLMKIPWVFLTDTDEFLSLNYPYLSGEQTASYKFPTTPELQDMARQFPITERGSVLRFLAHHQSVTKKTEKCLYVQRYQVGSQTANASLVERYLPYDNTTSQSQQLLNPHNMLTQNFLYRTPKHIKFGKNVLHLTAIDRIAKEPSNVHKVSSRHCVGVAGADGLASTSYLKINHYVGTPEQYLFRQDPRSRTNIHGGQANRPQKGIKENKGDQRNLERFNLLNVGTTHFSSDMQGWVQGFIQEVGLAKAQELLAGVGELGVE